MQSLPPIPAVVLQPSLPPPQLAEEHLRQIATAREGLRKIRRAVSVARFDGITLAVFAGVTLLFSLTSLSGLAIGLGMGIVAFFELRGVEKLRRLDAAAARTLGLNQLGLAALLIAYSLYCIHAELTGHGQLAALAEGDASLAQLLGPYEDTSRLVALTVYGAVIAIAVFAQGGLALYYFSRRRHIEAYLAKTPPWVIALQKADGSL